MRCRRCKSENIIIQTTNIPKIRYRGCFGWCLWLLLAACTCGLILIIPALTNSRTKYKNVTYAVCQNCGKKWRI